MLLSEPGTTSFDLKWRMFGFPVRVHPLFWIVSALLIAGWRLDGYDGRLLVLGIGCVFVSILVHELGHAVCGRVLGRSSKIVLYAMGGLAIETDRRRPIGTWGRIAILLAGPAAGFALYGVVYAIDHWLLAETLGGGSDYRRWAIFFLLEINLWWGLVNLLPIYPLDGGQIAHEYASHVGPHRGREVANLISIVVAALAAGWFLWDAIETRERLYFFPALFFGLLCFENIQRRRMMQAYGAEHFEPWERDPDWWKKG